MFTAWVDRLFCSYEVHPNQSSTTAGVQLEVHFMGLVAVAQAERGSEVARQHGLLLDLGYYGLV